MLLETQRFILWGKKNPSYVFTKFGKNKNPFLTIKVLQIEVPTKFPNLSIRLVVLFQRNLKSNHNQEYSHYTEILSLKQKISYFFTIS